MTTSLGNTCGTCGQPANEVRDHVVDGVIYHEGCIPPEGATTFGACGVPGCTDCRPLYDHNNQPIAGT